MKLIELIVKVPVTASTPRELREAFARAIVTGVLQAHLKGDIGTPEAEELIRTVPSPGHT